MNTLMNEIETKVKALLIARGKDYICLQVKKQHQMRLIGVYLGKGKIHITQEGINVTKSVCFGTDTQDVRGINFITRTVYDNEPNTVNLYKLFKRD